MNKTVILSVLCIHLGACTSTDTSQTASLEQAKYIDLTSDSKNQLLAQYWVSKKRVEPLYPIDAAKSRLSGCVDLVVGINSDGTWHLHKVKKSYPQGVFDKPTFAALSKWRWKAAANNVEKLPVLTTIQMDFMIQGSKNKNEADTQCGFANT
ncbi:MULTISPECIES: energy transducer TonB [Pseudoalteromonas]|uniref:TonB C-terminal domain-containing protein n=1 Tax=Pseudoalteromonas amylolytica TaxID=1859457 RepID=A0A1S1MWK1_9GAMM|nr:MULTISPECIES: energy transducer TonB [Pseudoalteromonas]OHU88027.1 hypothetical protein BFC16_11575 [Pseudoalteromonas sp. JW3]OHU91467.1 hypothetical protein BET10_11695 [Pseudoalteromonas amylolytica]